MIYEKVFPIFIGFDEVESVAYDVLCHSIHSRSSIPVAFIPVRTSTLRDHFQRKRDPKQSNEFSFTRFLVPYLMGYEGHALFMDLDMLVRTDIRELYDLRDDSKAVQVCQHDYVPSTKTKYLGNIQYTYPRKNWSSVMLFNCGHPDCKLLTPDYVQKASGLDLHRLHWTHDENIGALPLSWNWLVGEYKYNPSAKNVHFTIGGPWFDEYSHVDYATDWFEEKALMLETLQLRDIQTKASER